MHRHILRSFLLFLLSATQAAISQQTVQTPSDVYGELFQRVQLERVYDDSKTFVDTLPRRAPSEILSRYESERRSSTFSLRSFASVNFSVVSGTAQQYETRSGQDVVQHIDELWNVLTRAPSAEPPYSSRLALPQRFVVPGGRFNEIYYWDSYFTMLGLRASGREDLIAAMMDNFAYLIDTYGHIPNGNRSYYLSRSQPPFFAAMVQLEAQRSGESALVKRLPQLRREYAFWMEGEATTLRGTAHRRVVRLPDGRILNRYWDDRDTPREESFREDVETAKLSDRPAPEVYRDLRAAAESGWDFSSRWLADGRTLATIHTTDIVPVDLNSLLFNLERAIGQGCEAIADKACIRDMRKRSASRRKAIVEYLWSGRESSFVDYDWRQRRKLANVTAATTYPLFFGIADKRQAHDVAVTLRSVLLQPHGLGTTVHDTGQQWDAPNGWAPMQWMAIAGLQRYREQKLAGVIAQRWVSANLAVFRATGKLVEKYDVTGKVEGGGGEYPLQDGFGWTNGVLRKLLADRPALLQQ